MHNNFIRPIGYSGEKLHVMACIDDPCTAASAPVTIREIFDAFRGATGEMTMRGWQKRAEREQWVHPPAQYTFSLPGLPADVQEAVARYRERSVTNALQAHAQERIAAEHHENLPDDYTERQQNTAREKATFWLAVKALSRLHPGWTDRDCVRRAVLDAERANPYPYPILARGGRNGRSMLSLGDNPGAKWFPAYTNFVEWGARWRPFHDERITDPDAPGAYYQYWALAIEDKGGGLTIAAKYRQFGHEQFWIAFREKYVDSKAPSPEEAYHDALVLATKHGWLPVPSLRQVKYYYKHKLSEAAKRDIENIRRGRRYQHDKNTIFIIRDWRRVLPDDCWMFDGHKMDLMVRVWDPVKQGWVPDRPWLVNCIDSCSWFELGRHFTMVPGQDSVEYAIRNAVERHHRLAKMFYFDNGREFRAMGRKLVVDETRLVEICGNFFVRARFALPNEPQVKVNERDYKNVVNWFERKQLTYLGNAAVDKSNFDQRWHELHRPGAALERDGRGCLKNWHLVPELTDIAALYSEYRDADHHQRVRTGRICPNQSPAEKYLAVNAQNPVTDDDIARGFLYEVGPQLMDGDGRIYVRPRRCRADEELVYQGEHLLRYRGQHVFVKVDYATTPAPRAFAFEMIDWDMRRNKIVTRGDLKLIECAGEFGSVPLEFLPDALHATSEQIRDKKRTYARWTKGERDGDKARELNTAARELSEQIARDQGVTPGQARVYILKPDDVVAHAEGRQVATQRAADSRKRLRSKFSDEERLKLLTGEI